MKISALLITAFSLYSFLGVCPMQMSMMSGASAHDMAQMDMGTEVVASADGHQLVSVTSCSSCLRSVDHFALKQVAYSVSVPSVVFPQYISRYTSIQPLLKNIHPVANTGPPILASDIVQSIVVRT
jgi:Na+-translocating ferredoxin:NAD+ oxidoreductase RnfA subunit